MYDINRSNLLSAEIVKIHLYNISILGVSQTQVERQKKALLSKKQSLGIRNTFDETPYQDCHQESYNNTAFVIVLVLALLGPVLFIIASNQYLTSLFRSLMKSSKLGVGLFIILWFLLPYCCSKLYNTHKQKREMQYRLAKKEIALKEFRDAEEARLSKEAMQCMEITKEISHLGHISTRINRQLSSLYQQEILHPDYQSPQICGVMFQLFDTGRVHNLTDAMNLYEELRWKAEMQSLLQSLVKKADDMLSAVSNIEYYSRCTLENQKEAHRLLNGVSMKLSQISNSQEAIRVNTDVLRSNSETMRIIQELNFIYRN